MSIAEANSPEAIPLRRWAKQSEVMSEAWVAARLNEANLFCGGHAEAHEIEMWAQMVVGTWAYSCEGLVQALSDGVRSKVYGRLTYPQIAEWLNTYAAKITGLCEAEAARHKFVDNGGKDVLDRMEAGSQGEQLRAANERVRELERKLRHNG